MRNSSRFIALVSFLLVLLLANLAIHCEAEVLTLTPDTFSDKVNLLPESPNLPSNCLKYLQSDFCCTYRVYLAGISLCRSADELYLKLLEI